MAAHLSRQIQAMRSHQGSPEYWSRGPAGCASVLDSNLRPPWPDRPVGFESTVSQLKDEDTMLTGVLDRSALYGVLAEIEALGLDLVELRRLDPRRIEGA
jgi:hypothetical protein